MTTLSGGWTSRIGFVLTRVVVPLWVLSGATFKLIERTPKNLPEQIWKNASSMGIDLFTLLAILIFIEFAAVILMIASRRMARPLAISILGVFCLVLLNEMYHGNFKSCGCLGKLPVTPWQMLTIDAALLLGVVVFRPRYQPESRQPRWVGAAASIAILASLAITFGLVMKEGQPILDDPAIPHAISPSNGGDGGVIDPTINPAPLPLPNYFAADDIDKWVGMPWRDAPIFKLMRRWPTNMDEGTRYVVFYSRTCDHCHDMFRDDLVGPIGASVAAVEIPQSRTQLTGEGAWDLPQTQCELLALPLGPAWMVTPPLAIKVVDGVIACAQEKDHKRCMAIP